MFEVLKSYGLSEFKREYYEEEILGPYPLIVSKAK
jgi:hypothetical protein